MPEAMATDDEPGGDHARGAVLLSGARPRRNAVSPYLGVTIDQMIANKYGQDTILSSIQLGVEDTGNFGNCNWGYSCAYTNSISWTVAHAAAADASQSARGLRAPVRRRHERRRAADRTQAERQHPRFGHAGAGLFKKDLGAGDQRALDTYLENIRELERRIRIAMEQLGEGTDARTSRSACRRASTSISG